MKDRIKYVETFSMTCLFSTFLVMGHALDKNGYLNLQEWWKFAIAVAVTPFVTIVLHYIFNWIEQRLSLHEEEAILHRRELIAYAVFLAIAWGIVLLGVYPGFFVYDAGDELLQVITRDFTTHHPLLHVLYLGGTVQAGYKLFGTYNAGIFCFTMMQMLFFISGIVYVVYKMRSFGMHRYVCRGMILFMGLFPVYPMFVLCSCKDSIFSLVLLLWVVNTYEWWHKPGRYCRCRWILWAILMCLLRNNAMYALLVTVVCMIIFMKSYRKQLMGMTLLVLAFSTLISNGLAGIFHAEAGGKQELLTVPIQQLARTYQLDREVFSQEDEELLLSYIPKEYLERYTPKLSDAVKIGFQNEVFSQDSVSFLKLWLRIGLKSPISYLNAWLMTSYGYWYPNATVDVYKGNQVFTFTYEDNSYFGYETEQPGIRDSKITVIDEFYRKLSLETYKEKIPVVAQLFSMGFMFWVYIWIMLFTIRVRGIQSTMPYLLIFWTIATLLLGPTYLPRYVFFLWLVIPFMLGDICMGKNNRK